mgnify:CR=1 FL=1
MNIDTLLTDIERRRAEALDRKREAYPRNNPVASDIGECQREMVLSIVHWKERPLPDEWLVARFQRGNVIENLAIAELQALGFTVRVERTPFEITDKKGRVVLRGKVDGFLEWRDETGRHEVPFEVKSMDPNVYKRINSVEDFDHFAYTRKYPRQLCSYLYGNNLEAGFFLLDDCLGHWKLIPVTLDYAEMERILQRVEGAVEAVEYIRAQPDEEAAILPAYHPNPAVCHRCWCKGRVCFPPLALAGVTVADDPEFEAQLAQRESLEADAKMFDVLDKAVKERVRGKDGLIVGPYYITGKELIVNYKAKPASTGVQWRTKIERLAGETEAER